LRCTGNATSAVAIRCGISYRLFHGYATHAVLSCAGKCTVLAVAVLAVAARVLIELLVQQLWFCMPPHVLVCKCAGHQVQCWRMYASAAAMALPSTSP
jgi:hypothetical protein